MVDKSRAEPAEEFGEIDVHQHLGAESGAPAGEARDPRQSPTEPDADHLRRERDEYYDLLLRKTAEFDNYRKRIDRERRETTEQAAADLIRELLPVVDDLERALQAEAGADGAEAYRKGVELIHQQLLEVLRKRGVTPIEAVGARFDPHLHQAVITEVSPGHQEGDVIEEFRRGYKLGDRLLRPAMVKVATA
jgi:molecular chaperone GrpE